MRRGRNQPFTHSSPSEPGSSSPTPETSVDGNEASPGTGFMERVGAWFGQLTSLSFDERQKRLVEIGEQDRSLRRELESLLRAHDEAGGFLDDAMITATAREGLVSSVAAVGTDGREIVGEVVGRYRIEDLIAHGGMGSVYRATRVDDFEQRAAVKIIRDRTFSAATLGRFHRERQTLAKLQHPLITHLIDGGTTSDGTPFLVMEYVDGRRIDHYCDEKRLPVAARLELFCEVCDAVSYAHKNLIVHRDLKPSNILVSADGRLKLLDFGIAKLLSDEGDAAQDDATTMVSRVLTPRYASPEQIMGEPVTTASDVYSLGVLLYELLTGRSPLDPTSSTSRIRAIIANRRVDAPSAAVRRTAEAFDDVSGGRYETPEEAAQCRGLSVYQLHRRLRGDLDSIVVKALEDDPQHRYESVDALRADTQRHLAGLPVLARQSTFGYRIRKFVGRNRVAAGLAIGLAVSLLAGFAGTFVGMIRARQSERVAQAARTEAETVASFLQETLTAANPYRTGNDASIVLEMLTDAAARVDDDASYPPAVEAAVRYAIAETYAGLWHWREATPHLERSLALSRQLYGNQHAEVADCLILLGRALTFQRGPGAAALQREALAIRRKLFAEDSSEVAWSKTCLGFALWHAVRPMRIEEAEALLLEGLAVQREKPGTPKMELALALHTLGAMYGGIGRLEEGVTVLSEALDVYRSSPALRDRYFAECVRARAYSLRRLNRTDEELADLIEYFDLTPPGFRARPQPCHALRRISSLMRDRLVSSAEQERADVIAGIGHYEHLLSTTCHDIEIAETLSPAPEYSFH